jgi:glyoxylase-like metal-dependent hydrolase (beta-lactamase superfamily II)
MTRTAVFALLMVAAVTGSWGQGATDIQTVRLQDGLYLFKGNGGNVVLSVGADGALLVDDEYAVGTAQLVAAIATVTAQPVRFVINTHFHNDHTGGNESFGRAGAIIIAQENARRRMSTDQVMSLYGPQAAYAPVGQPKITFDQALQLHLNGNSIDLIYPGPAHTDGDTIIFFRERDVLMTGDLFVRAPYIPPYFDDLNGGSLEGMIHGVDQLLGLADERTLVMPGHGEPGTRSDVVGYRAQLVGARELIRQAIARGESEDALVAEHPLAQYWGAGRGVDRWVRIVYREYHR